MMKARELMTTRITCCTPDDSLRDAAQEMRDHDCGCIPIVEDLHSYRLVGVITDRDIACRGIAAGMTSRAPVRTVMSSYPKTCEPDDDIDVVERIMLEEQVRRVPVVDSRNRCMGMIAQADLALNRRSVSRGNLGRSIEQISEPASPSVAG